MNPPIQDKPAIASPIVLVPALNESAVIGHVIKEIRRFCDFPVVVLDDASTDNTLELARNAGAIVIPLAAQLGAWGAMQTGLRYAFRGFKNAIFQGLSQHPQPPEFKTAIWEIPEAPNYHLAPNQHWTLRPQQSAGQ